MGVVSGGAGGVSADRLDPHLEGLPQDKAILGVKPNGFAPGGQCAGHVNLDVFDVGAKIAVELFSFQIGVDRHLGLAASADRWDEVDGRDTALLTNEVHGGWCYLDIHGCVFRCAL